MKLSKRCLEIGWHYAISAKAQEKVLAALSAEEYQKIIVFFIRSRQKIFRWIY